MKRKKYILALLLVVLLAAAGWFSGWGISHRRADTRYRIPEKIVLPSSLRAGETASLSLDVASPRFDKLTSVEVLPGQGCVAGKVAIDRKVHWLTDEAKVSFALLALRSGKAPDGKVELFFADGKRASVVLPALEIAPGTPNPAQTIQLAGALPEKRSLIVLWYAGSFAALCLAIVAILWIVRRLRRKRTMNFYEKMLVELKKIPQSSVTAEAGVARLTDLVRHYLAVRFSCSVESASTGEFLHDLDRNHLPLPKELHPFLRDFLHDADQVKFARAAASREKLADAAEKAEYLVRATMPQEKEK